LKSTDMYALRMSMLVLIKVFSDWAKTHP
jgi:hypothetical protein